MINETATFTFTMVLSTERGELPDHEDIEKLVTDQMTGELDEETGLACLAVHLVAYSPEGDTTV